MINAHRFVTAGWNDRVKVLLLSGYSQTGKNTFAQWLTNSSIDTSKQWVLLSSTSQSSSMLPIVHSDYSNKNTSVISIANIAKHRYAKINRLPLSNLYIDGIREQYRSDLSKYCLAMKEAFGENFWLKLALEDIELSKCSKFIIVTDWRFKHELEYMHELRSRNLIGDVGTIRMIRDVAPKQMDMCLDNFKADGVIYGKFDGSSKDDNVIIQQIKNRFPQYLCYNNAVNIN
jgi:hypothetical protein